MYIIKDPRNSGISTHFAVEFSTAALCKNEVRLCGWAIASDTRLLQIRRGKSGLHRAACRLTAGRTVRFDGKCHRKYTASLQSGVRVKWCGKSAPRQE